MKTVPRLTVVCATFNARLAVRLTLASFRRHTRVPCRFLVADNGSTDGTLEDLRRVPWLEVYSPEDRWRSAPRPAGRALRPPVPGSQGPGSRTRHGLAIDWLAARVRTPYFLTLDSDVEFLAGGWLPPLLERMRRRGLAAIGDLEVPPAPGRPRLQPYLLLVRTAAYHRLGVSFQGFASFADPEEARRWRASRQIGLTPAEAAGYRSARFYDTGAAFFERLEEAGAPWATLPAGVARKVRHLGHMSWQGLPEGVEYVRRRLRILLGNANGNGSG